MISIYECGDSGEYCFGIYDAKYYNINFHKNSSEYKVIGQPGVADVTKQYLYQLAYDDFIAKQGYKYVQNMFFVLMNLEIKNMDGCRWICFIKSEIKN